MSVKLISITPEAEKIIAYCARVSNPSNQENYDTAPRLLKYCAKNGHWSVFEQAFMTLSIETSRGISAQLLRHKSMNFQEFCVSEGTLITCENDSGNTKKIPIEKLYSYQGDPRMEKIWGKGIRVYDETTKIFVKSIIKEIFKTNEKECLEVVLEDGKKLTCTEEHKLYNMDGFVKLKDCKVGDFVAVNGVPVYQSYEWLKSRKEKCINEGVTIDQIAEEAGVSYHTIRSWLKKLKLCFTPQERAKVIEIWNKGLPKEKQPRFGKSVSDESREKMKNSSRKGKESNLYKGGKERSERQKIYDWQNKYKNKLLIESNHQCSLCKSKEGLEVDHIEPVCFRPDLAYEYSNLRIICKQCHSVKTREEMVLSKNTIRFKKIISITPVGKKQTYDIEVNHHSHNYIANGIVTHNSQRYASIDDTNIEIPQLRRQDTKNRQNSIDDIPDINEAFRERIEKHFSESLQLYRDLLEQGVAKECARFVLPLSTKTRLYMSGTIRSFIHYCQTRCHESTQKEHRDIAIQVRDILLQQLPSLRDILDPVSGEN
jgi:thymidylate synthase (FAD)